jgi:hypothetical protein
MSFFTGQEMQLPQTYTESVAEFIRKLNAVENTLNVHEDRRYNKLYWGVPGAHFVALEKAEESKLIALYSYSLTILDSNTDSGHNGVVRAIIWRIYTLHHDLDKSYQ